MADDLADLIARLTEATGPDREIDLDLWRLFGDLPPAVHERWDYQTVPYTASVDASLALVERVLPGKHWSLGWWDEGFRCEFLVFEEGEWWYHAGKGTVGEAPTLPLAILVALLRAKQATP